MEFMYDFIPDQPCILGTPGIPKTKKSRIPRFFPQSPPMPRLVIQNFRAGVLTDHRDIIHSAGSTFDAGWFGEFWIVQVFHRP